MSAVLRPLTREERDLLRLEVDRARREKIRAHGHPGKGGALKVPDTLRCEGTTVRGGRQCGRRAKYRVEGRAYCGIHTPVRSAEWLGTG